MSHAPRFCVLARQAGASTSTSTAPRPTSRRLPGPSNTPSSNLTRPCLGFGYGPAGQAAASGSKTPLAGHNTNRGRKATRVAAVLTGAGRMRGGSPARQRAGSNNRRAASPPASPKRKAQASTSLLRSYQQQRAARNGSAQQQQPCFGAPDILFCSALGLCVVWSISQEHHAAMVQHAAALNQFGPADVSSSTFGPFLVKDLAKYHAQAAATARAAAAASVYSPGAAAATAAAMATAAAATTAAAAAEPSLLHLLDPAAVAAGVSYAADALYGNMAHVSDAVSGSAAVATHAVDALARSTWGNYNAWLAASPLLCKVVTGNFFTVAGDLLAQMAAGGDAHGSGSGAPSSSSSPSPSSSSSSAASSSSSLSDEGRGASPSSSRRYDPMRTLRLCIETSFFGTPLAHWWYNFLEVNVYPQDPHSTSTVLTKMVLDQTVLAPLGLAMFFCVIKCLEGRPKEIPETLRTKYVKAAIGGWMLWPAANLINFTVVPLQYRVLFANVVNIAWTFFLSTTQASKPGAAATHAAAEPAGYDGPSAFAMAAASASGGGASSSIGGPSSSPPPHDNNNNTNGSSNDEHRSAAGSGTLAAVCLGTAATAAAAAAALAAASPLGEGSASAAMACLACLAGAAAVEAATLAHASAATATAALSFDPFAAASDPTAAVVAVPIPVAANPIVVSAGAYAAPCLELLQAPADALAETFC